MPRLPLILLAVFIPIVIASGIQPLDRGDWLLENVLVFIIVPLLALTARRFPFSNTSYLCLFVFQFGFRQFLTKAQRHHARVHAVRTHL